MDSCVPFHSTRQKNSCTRISRYSAFHFGMLVVEQLTGHTGVNKILHAPAHVRPTIDTLLVVTSFISAAALAHFFVKCYRNAKCCY